MIKYIKKLIKKRRLLKKYKEKIDNNLNILNYINYSSYHIYKKIEKEMQIYCRCYNRLKKL